jgi:CTP synthase (UTP-ammonia lyase)
MRANTRSFLASGGMQCAVIETARNLGPARRQFHRIRPDHQNPVVDLPPSKRSVYKAHDARAINGGFKRRFVARRLYGKDQIVERLAPLRV